MSYPICVCTLLCSWYVLAVSRKGKERTTHGEIDKEHLILWDRRDLNRCTDKGAFARITGSTSLKSFSFLSTEFDPCHAANAEQMNQQLKNHGTLVLSLSIGDNHVILKKKKI